MNDIQKKRNIVEFCNGSKLFHATGNIDDWCVYFEKRGDEPIARRDEEYFGDLMDMKNKYGGERIYRDFVKIYDKTTGQFNPSIFSEIEEIARTYLEDGLKMMILLSTLYMAMVSEFNYLIRGKIPSKMKNKLKRLAVYQITMENYTPQKAANFSRNRGSKELTEECRKRGF